MAIVMPVGLALALGAIVISSATLAVGQVKTIPPETVQASILYDSASGKLTLVCELASRNLCRFTVVDGARTKQVSLRPRTRHVIGAVSAKARACSMGRNPGSACNLVPVTA